MAGGALVFAEVAMPPFGYVAVDRQSGDSEMIRSKGMCEIGAFGDRPLLAIETVHLRIPVLYNVGPGALQYAPTPTGYPSRT